MSNYPKETWSLGEPECRNTGGLFVSVNSPDHGELATVVWRMEDDSVDGLPSLKCEANAKLIVAAPQLYRAAWEAMGILIAIRDGSMSRNNQEAMIDEAIEALTKATAKAAGE